jgi:DNA-binding transcriptional regulator YdaS (Cro superfamily)
MKAENVIEHFGSQVAAAQALGLSKQAVYQWTKRGISFRTQLLIEHATGGKLKADPVLKRETRIQVSA